MQQKQTVTEARIGARFGARQTGKKNTNWSTIWCTEQDRIYRSLGETWDQSGFEAIQVWKENAVL